jgi:peptidoglycan hydrolase-like protein with peptidoglycan-binding domain
MPQAYGTTDKCGEGAIYGPSGCSGCCTGYDGQGSDEIQKIQIYLAALGYLDGTSTTGRYGSKTYDAVLRFQKDYGLSQDGRVGSETLALLSEQATRRQRAESALSQVPDTSYRPPALLPPPPDPKLTDSEWFWPAVVLSSAATIGMLLWWARRKAA